MKHGMSRTRVYNIWQKMIERCHNPTCHNYWAYGARGILVSEDWRNSFEIFLADMGDRPDVGYQIDRIDNSQGYSKENCRWATVSEQARNRRSNVYIDWNGNKRLLIEVSTELQLTKSQYMLALRRKKMGWDDSDLFVPSGHYGYHPLKVGA